MSANIGIGFSQNPDPAEAAREAVIQAKTQANALSINLAIVFCTIHYCGLETAAVIRQTLHDAKIIGTSTAGIIMPDFVATRGIAVMVMSSDQMRFGIGSLPDLDKKELRQAGTKLAKSAITDFGQFRRQIFLLFTGGFIKSHSLLIKGVEDVFGQIFPVLGGCSIDDFHFEKSYQYFQDQFMEDSACGVLLGGQMNIGFGIKHGWKPLGKPRVVDKVSGTVIKSIDGKRAVSVYEDYFQKDAKDLQSTKLGQLAIMYPLGIYIESQDEYLLRNAVDILPDGSIICQGEVPEGTEVHIMIGNKEYCQQAAVEAAQQVRDTLYGKQPKLVLVFESMARQKLLGKSAAKEIQMIKEVLGQTTPIIGMYSFGEIAPFRSKNNIISNHIQNESIVIVGFE